MRFRSAPSTAPSASSDRSPWRRPARAAAALVTVVVGVIGSTGVAGAHHPEVRATMDCAGVVAYVAESWAGTTAAQKTNPSIEVAYAMNGAGGPYTAVTTGAFAASGDFRFLGSFDPEGTPATVWVRVKALAAWGTGTNGGQTRATVVTAPAGCVPPVVDVCSNLDGVQAEVPEGAEAGPDDTCIPPVVDVCSNLDGVQAEVPEGAEAGPDGTCVPPVVDVCSNLDGVQAEVPGGLVGDGAGGCTEPVVTAEETPVATPVDVCSNLDGLQESAPEGTTVVDGTCVAPAAEPTPVVPAELAPEPVPAALIPPLVLEDDVVTPLVVVEATPAVVDVASEVAGVTVVRSAPVASAPAAETQVLGVSVTRSAGIDRLAATGVESSTVAAAGAGLLLGGLALMAAARRRDVTAA